MGEWQSFLKEAGQYLSAGRGKEGKPSRLSSDIRYNLLSLSIEKSCMAILLYHNDLADNHTFVDLLRSIAPYVQVPGEVHDELAALEQVQSICNLYEYHREKPSEEVVQRLLAVAVQLSRYAEQTCSRNAGTPPVNHPDTVSGKESINRKAVS